jgi:hypothetical protein
MLLGPHNLIVLLIGSFRFFFMAQSLLPPILSVLPSPTANPRHDYLRRKHGTVFGHSRKKVAQHVVISQNEGRVGQLDTDSLTGDGCSYCASPIT